jgi:hypothetical protein
VLLRERGHDRHDCFDTGRPVGALCPHTPVAPHAPRTARARRGMVGRLPAFDTPARPQGLVPCEPLATDARSVDHATGLTSLQQACALPSHRTPQPPERGLRPRPITDARPRLQPLAGLSAPGGPPLLRTAAARAHRLPIPQQLRPPHVPPVGGRPRVGTPAIRAHQTAAPFAPPLSCATLAPRASRPTKPVTHAVTAPTHARARPARHPVSSRWATGGLRPEVRAASTGVAKACTVACSRRVTGPRRKATPHRSARTSWGGRFDRR